MKPFSVELKRAVRCFLRRFKNPQIDGPFRGLEEGGHFDKLGRNVRRVLKAARRHEESLLFELDGEWIALIWRPMFKSHRIHHIGRGTSVTPFKEKLNG